MTHGQSLDETRYVAEANRYIAGVLSGNTPACRWLRLACERQIKDLERFEHGWDWTFDKDKASRICYFIEQLPHIKGRWRTRTISLEPWQCFVLTTLFGWVDERGCRRFRNALLIMPRKNGKTVIAAAIGLYLLALDAEPGAEVYSVATTRDQARISWEIAKRVVERTSAFQDRFGISPLAHSITVESNAACFRPLSRDSDSLEGLNPHGVIIDELHAHKTREVFAVMDEAEGARSQPLKFMISTEGDGAVGIFCDQKAYLQQILEGNHQDDTYFGAIWSIDPEDLGAWTSEEVWQKANPNLHVQDANGEPVLLRSLQARIKRAVRDAASQSSFMTKRLCFPAGASEAYLNSFAWSTICKDESMRIGQFAGCRNVMAIDLASKSDLAARMTVFRGDGRIGQSGHYYVFGSYYLPEGALTEGSPNYDFYRGWKEGGYLIFTSGPRTDYDLIETELERDCLRFQPEFVGADPNYNAEHFRQNMERRGITVGEIPHTVLRMSEPTKELAALILAGKIHHDGDPVLSWAIGNVRAKEDVKGNVYPRKARRENKIDPAVALIAALSEWLRQPVSASVYASAETAII